MFKWMKKAKKLADLNLQKTNKIAFAQDINQHH